MVDTSGANPLDAACASGIATATVLASSRFAIKSCVFAIVYNLHRTINVATNFAERTTSFSNSCRNQNEKHSRHHNQQGRLNRKLIVQSFFHSGAPFSLNVRTLRKNPG